MEVISLPRGSLTTCPSSQPSMGGNAAFEGEEGSASLDVGGVYSASGYAGWMEAGERLVTTRCRRSPPSAFGQIGRRKVRCLGSQPYWERRVKPSAFQSSLPTP